MKLFLAFFLTFLSCHNNSLSQDNNSNLIIIIKTDKLEQKKGKINIYNSNKKIFGTILGDDESEPKCDLLKSKIKHYYPENYIIHFDGFHKNNLLYVKIDNNNYQIEKSEFIEVMKLEDYILRYYCVTDETNPLRKEPSLTGEILNCDLTKLSFECLEIKNDWVKIKCNIECEGCGNLKKELVGWIRWRFNKKFILKQKLIC